MILFAFLYTLNVAIILLVHVKTDVVLWWALCLLSLSKRLLSIFMLRLFNDCVAMTVLHDALLLVIHQRCHLGLIMFSGAVSVKMNVLLYAPPLLLLMLKMKAQDSRDAQVIDIRRQSSDGGRALRGCKVYGEAPCGFADTGSISRNSNERRTSIRKLLTDSDSLYYFHGH